MFNSTHARVGAHYILNEKLLAFQNTKFFMKCICLLKSETMRPLSSTVRKITAHQVQVPYIYNIVKRYLIRIPSPANLTLEKVHSV